MHGTIKIKNKNKLKNIYITSNLIKLLCKSTYQTGTQRLIINEHQARKDVLGSVSRTFNSGSEVAVFHVLSSRIFVTRGKRIEIPAAV
jgi:creatinine amidohydrolase/Fe(II)-dependent formamide hydrolase-like protein